MKKTAGLSGTRRDVLKSGVAAIGLAAVGLPVREAAAASILRPDVATTAGQAMLHIYENAVRIMKDPKINNPPQPHSWTFQAYIHALPVNPTDPNSDGYTNGSPEFKKKIDDIYGVNPPEPVASWKKAALACWSTCPHGSPYFLPWHRWYMYYFEQVIRRVSGQKDFLLPYWAYGSSPTKSLQLPKPFQDKASPLYEEIRGKGFTNPLNLTSQTQPMNENGYLGYPLVDYTGTIVATQYYPADTGEKLYFPPSSGWYQYGYTGRTETQPHDNVHDGVGGLMGNVPTAAQDPIFYLHHCQIDHLWASWQNIYGYDNINFSTGAGTDAQPTQAQWSAQVAYFVDGASRLVKVGYQKVLDYRALGYGYDSYVPSLEGKPVAEAAAKVTLASAATGQTTLSAKPDVEVGSGGTTLTLAPPDANAKALTAAQAQPKTLHLKNLRLRKRPPAPLYVFLNLPANTPAEVGGPYYLGPISHFKLKSGGSGSHAGHSDHGGHGMESASFAYDVETILQQQRQKGLWSGGPVTVTIAPAGQVEASGTVYMSIGSVELSN